MIYDLAPGQLVEADYLDEEQVAKARADLAGGRSLKRVAQDLGGEVYKPPRRQRRGGVVVDAEALAAAVDEETFARLVGDAA